MIVSLMLAHHKEPLISLSHETSLDGSKLLECEH